MTEVTYIRRSGPQRSQLRSERIRGHLEAYAATLEEMSDDELALEQIAKEENRDALSQDLNNEYQRITDRGKQWQLTAERVSSALKAELKLVYREVHLRRQEAAEQRRAEKAAERAAEEARIALAREEKAARRAAHEKSIAEAAERRAQRREHRERF